ncbi:hypothetical protein [Zavarzinia compransoris]|uniref:Uncharacterized protein n=1 Tax=Zavarzinia compransoris TaxID=1264899 RepID=A0A317DTS4_9PROT|nr:hypothetical protein [Zavarzinia compransoris]PWR17772.1 hypothetical protein DKG75_21755 [Zavarzinia compransoris]TDP49301.1 hypothetical protein DES42_101673 [Zavarzinia compransoris]
MSVSSLPSGGALAGLSARSRSLLWLGFITLAGAAFSLVLACATPFAALAAIAALNLSRRDAVLAVVLAWAVNQAIGFGLLSYPHDASTYAWGGAIGISALLSLAGAVAAAGLLARRHALVRGLAGFVAAFVVWQLALYASALAIGNGEGAFSAAIVGYVLQMNVLALAILAVVHQAAISLGLVARPVPAFA